MSHENNNVQYLILNNLCYFKSLFIRIKTKPINNFISGNIRKIRICNKAKLHVSFNLFRNIPLGSQL